MDAQQTNYGNVEQRVASSTNASTNEETFSTPQFLQSEIENYIEQEFRKGNFYPYFDQLEKQIDTFDFSETSGGDELKDLIRSMRNQFLLFHHGNKKMEQKEIEDLYKIIDTLRKEIKEIDAKMHATVTQNIMFKDEIRTDLFENSKEIAVIREWINSIERVITDLKEDFHDIKAYSENIHKMLQTHVEKEDADRIKLIAGIVTAVISSLGSFGILIWGVFEILSKTTLP